MTYRVNLTRMPAPADDEAEHGYPPNCPVCGRDAFDDACLHCYCPTHQRWTEVDAASSGSGAGFTGAAIYWTTLRCGCQDVDTSGDSIEAVR